MTIIGLCVCLFLLWLFALAAYHKLANLTHYSELMLEYLPVIKQSSLLRSAVFCLALLELSVALLLLLPVTRTAALIMAVIVLSVYATVMAVQLILGRRQLNCGCAGPASSTQISTVLVVRNVVLIVLAVIALVVGASIAVSIYSLLLTLCLTAFMIFLYLCAEQLISNGQQLATLKNV